MVSPIRLSVRSSGSQPGEVGSIPTSGTVAVAEMVMHRIVVPDYASSSLTLSPVGQTAKLPPFHGGVTSSTLVRGIEERSSQNFYNNIGMSKTGTFDVLPVVVAQLAEHRLAKSEDAGSLPVDHLGIRPLNIDNRIS